ncbi:alpha/beta fold hydrolase [Streptomyces sp. ST2-7A]|uniref:alpha/beta fold hydrolase n=1 Tax=Streptomyces sp. ST2-7A TaxID=2907214 RepID=UPI001F2CB041|nr:alpha/beta hydrolase [Streptomyces sp. ST2-7A]MCE7079496.1 alpha/beta hydrolase [Streptomyces sp. ST2-7A]
MNTVQSADGTPIAYDRSGSGEPVILVGGSFSQRLHPTMTQLAEALSAHFTVYNYDRRGRGDSGDADSYSAGKEIEDLAALVSEAGDGVNVFGLSAGGALALKAAAAGVPFSRVVVYDPPFVVDETGPRPPAGFGKTLADLTATERRGDAVELFMTRAMGAPAEAVAGMRMAPFWGGLESLAHTLSYDIELMGDFSLPTDELGTITTTVLVAHGDQTPPWLHSGARATAEALPNGRLRTLEGQGIEVDTAKLAPELTEFFTK